MKKIILSLIAVMMTVCVMAQGQRREFNPEEMATRQATELKKVCNLSDEQYKAVYDLYIKSANRMKAERDSIMAAGGDFRQRGFNREAMQKRQEEQNAALKAIMTEEQYAAYTKMQSERRQRFGQGGPRQRQ